MNTTVVSVARRSRALLRAAAISALLASVATAAHQIAPGVAHAADSPGSAAVKVGSPGDAVDLYSDPVGATPCSDDTASELTTLTVDAGGYVYVEPGLTIGQEPSHPVIDPDGDVLLELDDEADPSQCASLLYDWSTGLPELSGVDTVLNNTIIPERETPIELKLLPLNSSTFSGTDPVVGSGATGSSGDIQAALEAGLGGYDTNSAFVDDYANLEVFYLDSDGTSWDDSGTRISYYLSGDTGPFDRVLNQRVATDPSSGE